MLILLAALIQAAPALAADPVQAAMTCRSATLAGRNPLPLEIAARHLYFTMAAARALPGNDDYFRRMAAIASRPYPRVRPRMRSGQAICATGFTLSPGGPGRSRCPPTPSSAT
jgi:hypothetical protein